jgi:aryl-alcohol dehydrogenase-like predicted oxidoreductase
VEAVLKVAAQRGVSPAQIALAWVLINPVVSSPIVGATKPEHLADAAASIDVVLTPEEIATLQEGYQPHRVAGFQ